MGPPTRTRILPTTRPGSTRLAPRTSRPRTTSASSRVAQANRRLTAAGAADGLLRRRGLLQLLASHDEARADSPGDFDEDADADEDIERREDLQPAETPSEQSDEAAKPAAESTTEAAKPAEKKKKAAKPAETVAQENARRSAESYLDLSGFSRSGLIEQLEYEGFTPAQAAYAADKVGL
jgi:Host cell surface-exposed lipoprotein